MPKRKFSAKCSYCRREAPYLYNKNRLGRVRWAICLSCLIKLCDKALGRGKDGGRVSDD